MTRNTLGKIAAGLLATTIGLAALPAPASAGGTFSIDVSPGSSGSEQAMRTGLQLYSMYNAIESGAGIRQRGHGNSAGIEQNGRRNSGIVHQEGRGHNGTLRQNGNGNSYGLFQFGRDTDGHVEQRGNGGTGATFQFGW